MTSSSSAFDGEFQRTITPLVDEHGKLPKRTRPCKWRWPGAPERGAQVRVLDEDSKPSSWRPSCSAAATACLAWARSSARATCFRRRHGGGEAAAGGGTDNDIVGDGTMRGPAGGASKVLTPSLADKEWSLGSRADRVRVGELRHHRHPGVRPRGEGPADGAEPAAGPALHPGRHERPFARAARGALPRERVVAPPERLRRGVPRLRAPGHPGLRRQGARVPDLGGAGHGGRGDPVGDQVPALAHAPLRDRVLLLRGPGQAAGGHECLAHARRKVAELRKLEETTARTEQSTGRRRTCDARLRTTWR